MENRRMRLRLGWAIAAVSIAIAVGLPACSRSSAGESEAPPPAEVEPIEGSDLARVILTEDAAKRLDIQTDTVRSMGHGEAIPYSAVLYDPEGRTWAYTNPEPLTYVRAPIDVARIKGQVAVLSSGPPAGTTIVTVGASELLGTEYEVGEE